jgi:peroxiredoxin
LCDTERRLIREWDIYNPREKGGIAKPALFVIDRDRIVRYTSVDAIASRVPAAEMVGVLQTTAQMEPVQRKVYIPALAHCFRAIRK